MKHRLMAVATVVAALAAPATAAAATFGVTADADSQYGSGAISSKTFKAAIAGGGDVKQVVFSEQLLSSGAAFQVNLTAAGAMLLQAADGTCTNASEASCLGTVAVSLNGALTPAATLAVNTGVCDAMHGITAPPPGTGNDATGEVQIIFAGNTAIAPLVSPAQCLGVRVDAYYPGLGDPGHVDFTVDLTALAEKHLGIAITEADLTLNNLSIQTGAMTFENLFNDNPATPDTIDDTITVTPCVATMMTFCGAAGTPEDDVVRETRGGANTVSITDLPNPIKYGTTVHLTGQTSRGAGISPGETVTPTLIVSATSHIVLPSVTGDLMGNYNATWRATKSGTFHIASQIPAGMATPHSNSMVWDSNTFKVVAGTPVVKKKLTHKQKIRGKVYYDVKLTITAASGLTVGVKVNGKTKFKVSAGTFSVTYKKLRDNTLITITSTAPNVTSGKKLLKV